MTLGRRINLECHVLKTNRPVMPDNRRSSTTQGDNTVNMYATSIAGGAGGIPH
jgi:hypothetical protein